MHILFTEPGSFQRYVVVSPSLWWDDGVLQRTADTMPERSAKLFLSFGELEPRGLMHEPVARMDALLRSRDWPDFQYSYTVFSGVGHGSVVPLGHSQGLRAVFEPNMDEPPSE
jgi:predicted alpha/beta superfamily hydrolase